MVVLLGRVKHLKIPAVRAPCCAAQLPLGCTGSVGQLLGGVVQSRLWHCALKGACWVLQITLDKVRSDLAELILPWGRERSNWPGRILSHSLFYDTDTVPVSIFWDPKLCSVLHLKVSLREGYWMENKFTQECGRWVCRRCLFDIINLCFCS